MIACCFLKNGSTSSVDEGEKFRIAEIYINNIDIGGAYRLVPTNTN